MLALLFILGSFISSSNGDKVSANGNYVLVETLKQREAAKQNCQTVYGTHLASVHCAEQNAEIVALLDSSPLSDRAFIGLYSNGNTFDDGTPKDWTWTGDGRQYYSGDCCAVEIIAGRERLWNDLSVNHHRLSVCNYAPVEVIATCKKLTNECEKGTDNCSPNAQCTDTALGFNCKCKAGFADVNGDGTNCVDIDECASSSSNDCSENATCNNLVGGTRGYKCICNSGFKDIDGDGTLCLDIDECKDGIDDCGNKGVLNARCVNNIGGYSCECANDMVVTVECAQNEVNQCTSIGDKWKCQCVNQTGSQLIILDYPLVIIGGAILLIISLLFNIVTMSKWKNKSKQYKRVKYLDTESE